jgi:cobalamin synthase
MDVGAKRFGVRARSAAFSDSPTVAGDVEKAALRARAPKRFAPAFMLPIVSTVLLVVVARAQEIFPAISLHPMLTFPALVIGSWPGLALLGHVADAFGATVPSEARQQILDDRYLGSFGVCAVAVSILIQLSAVLTSETLSSLLAALPLAAALIGLLSGLAMRPAPPLVRSASLIAALLVCLLMAGLAAYSVTVALSGAAALITAWALRDSRRNGRPVAGVMAGHVALLWLLTFGAW